MFQKKNEMKTIHPYFMSYKTSGRIDKEELRACVNEIKKLVVGSLKKLIKR